MCQIGLTKGLQGPRATLQLCWIPGHTTWFAQLWDLVPSSAWASLLTEALSESPLRLTASGDVSTSVTLTLSRDG